MTSAEFKAKVKSAWRQIDGLLYLFLAFGTGAVIASFTMQIMQSNERANLNAERVTLYATISDVRTQVATQCDHSLTALRSTQTERANDWLKSLGEMSTQVQNANHNADNCHAQMAALIPKINKAANDSKVAADKSTEAAQAATSEHAQQTLIRKYSK